MALTSRVHESDLFRLLTKKRALKHPTAKSFSAEDWHTAYKNIETPTDRDRDLLLGATYLGMELATLREKIQKDFLPAYDRERGMQLLAAIANQQFLALNSKVRKAHARAARQSEETHVELAIQRPIRGAGGQEVTADDHATQIVDALPHWIFHIVNPPEGAVHNKDHNSFQAGSHAIMVASIERGLRDLWLSILWEGHKLNIGEQTSISPADRGLAEQWQIWHLRNSSNSHWETIADSSAGLAFGPQLKPVIPVNERTVLKIEKKTGRKRQFIVGTAKGSSPSQRSHVSERDALDRLYTGLFLDTPHPLSGDLKLTCRELNHAWWILVDIARLLIEDLSGRRLSDSNGLEMASCTVKCSEIEDAISRALGVTGDRSRAIISLFCCDIGNATELFTKGLWANPLLPASGQRYHIILAPLLVGSPVRRVEAWLERGGVTDQRELSGRGKPFESHVRKRVHESLSENPLVTDFSVVDHSLKRTRDSEEVDLLFRICDTIVVGEVKCFIAPVEPLDRYNYLKSLELAAEQAQRKCKWAEANRPIIMPMLDIPDERRTANFRFLPMVLLNQGFGFGLDLEGVAVTDLHFLSLLLSTDKYQNHLRIERGSILGASTRMYSTQYELASRIGSLLKNPPPLQRYRGALGWTEVPFPTSTGRPFAIELPRLTNMPVEPRILSKVEEWLSKPDGR